MFGKLLKYEWRSSRKVLLILSLAALALSIPGGLLAWYLRDAITGLSLGTYSYPEPVSETLVLTITLAAFALYFGMFLLAAYQTAVQIILVIRFYQSRFTDQGYLTFTLPATTKQIYWSGVVHMLIWSAISSLVILLTVSIVAGVGFYGTSFWSSAFVSEMTETYREFFTTMGFRPSMWVLSYVLAAVSELFGILFPLACVILGSTIAKRAKLLLSFGLYYGASTVFGFLAAIVSMAVMMFTIISGEGSIETAQTSMTVIWWLLLVFMSVLTVLCYVLSIRRLNNKLNLT